MGVAVPSAYEKRIDYVLASEMQETSNLVGEAIQMDLVPFYQYFDTQVCESKFLLYFNFSEH
jgi:hypothetical protein